MRSFLTTVGNEIYKGLRFAWAERLQILIELPMFVILILLTGPILGQADKIASGDLTWTLDSQSTSILVAWFIPFSYFYLQIVKVFWRLLAEKQTGTLEQVYLSPLPSWVITAVGRVVATVVETILIALVMFAVVDAFVPLRFDLTASLLLPLLLMMVTGVGVSLIIAGATLVWGRIEMVVESVTILMFIGGASALPLVIMPSWWENISQVFPVNQGLENIFGVLFQRRSATTPWGPGGIVWVLAIAAAYLAVGILAYRLGERTAKRRGSLSSY